MMKTVLHLLLVFSCVFAFDNSDDFINEINSKQNFWKAGRNFHEDTPESHINGLLGLKTIPSEIVESIPIVKHEINADEIPESFDARTHWPQCKTIKQVQDQSACGSCWAVSVASAASDRICIHSNGKLQPEISSRYILTCSGQAGNGCIGGSSYLAWTLYVDRGFITGGPFGSKIGCQPYPFPPCEHNVNGTKTVCPEKVYRAPQCQRYCDNKTIDFENDRYYGALRYRLQAEDEKEIQAEILKHGPVVAGFEVYADFLQYKSGVYVKTSDKWKGSHAVRVIGWGVEKGTKYWLIVNSWNDDWGDKGLFKIRRGVNECGIEASISSGMPR